MGSVECKDIVPLFGDGNNSLMVTNVIEKWFEVSPPLKEEGRNSARFDKTPLGAESNATKCQQDEIDGIKFASFDKTPVGIGSSNGSSGMLEIPFNSGEVFDFNMFEKFHNQWFNSPFDASQSVVADMHFNSAKLWPGLPLTVCNKKVTHEEMSDLLSGNMLHVEIIDVLGAMLYDRYKECDFTWYCVDNSAVQFIPMASEVDLQEPEYQFLFHPLFKYMKCLFLPVCTSNDLMHVRTSNHWLLVVFYFEACTITVKNTAADNKPYLAEVNGTIVAWQRVLMRYVGTTAVLTWPIK